MVTEAQAVAEIAIAENGLVLDDAIEYVHALASLGMTYADIRADAPLIAARWLTAVRPGYGGEPPHVSVSFLESRRDEHPARKCRISPHVRPHPLEP